MRRNKAHKTPKNLHYHRSFEHVRFPPSFVPLPDIKCDLNTIIRNAIEGCIYLGNNRILITNSLEHWKEPTVATKQKERTYVKKNRTKEGESGREIEGGDSGVESEREGCQKDTYISGKGKNTHLSEIRISNPVRPDRSPRTSKGTPWFQPG